MADYRSLPLGLDIGTSRVRMVLLERGRRGFVRLRAVAARSLPNAGSSAGRPQELGAIIASMRAEIGTKERRCVLSVGAPDALVHTMTFPKMTGLERAGAARLEAKRIAPWDVEEQESVVRVQIAERAEYRYVVGVLRTAVLAARRAVVRAAGLRLVALDYDGFALQRAFPDLDAIIDIGTHRSRLHAFIAGTPCSWYTDVGGSDMTSAIAAEFGLDAEAAEKRKRIVGLAGIENGKVAQIATNLSSMIHEAQQRIAIRRVGVTGNGARLTEIVAHLRLHRRDVEIDVPVAEILRGDAYPDDVVRSAATDWAHAAGLALHASA